MVDDRRKRIDRKTLDVNERKNRNDVRKCESLKNAMSVEGNFISEKGRNPQIRMIGCMWYTKEKKGDST